MLVATDIFHLSGCMLLTVGARLGARSTASAAARSVWTGRAPRPSVRENELPSTQPPLVLHCGFGRNNTILTLSRRVYKYERPPQKPELEQEYMIDQVRPNQEVLLTVTTGQLGFKGTHKGTYDAAFQTAAKMFKEMEDKGYIGEPIELVTRNFGQNRHAFFATLMGREGVKVSKFIRQITDATRIKFGGDRSPNKRRV